MGWEDKSVDLGTPREEVGAAAIEELPPLSPERAFVVQFRVGAGMDPERFTGRVEHMVSGGAAHFDSLEELVAFVTRVLAEVGD